MNENDTNAAPIVPPTSASGCSANDSEKRRADALANNCKWLVDKIDRIHDVLCPDICGTWQQRATDAVAEAQKVRKQMDELHACLKEAMEGCKPCNYTSCTWRRRAAAMDAAPTLNPTGQARPLAGRRLDPVVGLPN